MALLLAASPARVLTLPNCAAELGDGDTALLVIEERLDLADTSYSHIFLRKLLDIVRK